MLKGAARRCLLCLADWCCGLRPRRGNDDGELDARMLRRDPWALNRWEVRVKPPRSEDPDADLLFDSEQRLMQLQSSGWFYNMERSEDNANAFVLRGTEAQMNDMSSRMRQFQEWLDADHFRILYRPPTRPPPPQFVFAPFPGSSTPTVVVANASGTHSFAAAAFVSSSSGTPLLK